MGSYFHCQSGLLQQLCEFFSSKKVQSECDELSSLHFLLFYILSILCFQGLEHLLPITLISILPGVPADPLTRVSGSAWAYGFPGWDFNLRPARIHKGPIHPTTVVCVRLNTQTHQGSDAMVTSEKVIKNTE